MNDIRQIDWAKLKIEPLDEHLPTPASIHRAWMRSRRGLWHFDLYAGYDWNVDAAIALLKSEGHTWLAE
jgi:hypothetical protein